MEPINLKYERFIELANFLEGKQVAFVEGDTEGGEVSADVNGFNIIFTDGTALLLMVEDDTLIWTDGEWIDEDSEVPE